MAVTIPFQQMAFPVKTSERVPLEDIQLWAQFAEVSNVPETFQVVADRRRTSADLAGTSGAVAIGCG